MYSREEILEMTRDELIDTGAASIGIDTHNEYDFVTTTEARNSVLRHYGHEEVSENQMTLTEFCAIIGADITFDGRIAPISRASWNYCNAHLVRNWQRMKLEKLHEYGRSEGDPPSLTEALDDLADIIRGQEIFFGENSYRVPEDLIGSEKRAEAHG